MLSLALLLVPIVLANSSTLVINEYIVNIANDTLTSVRTTPTSRNELNLARLDIKRIGSSSFEKAPRMKTLNLVGNDLTTLPDSAFSNLENLERLYLARNRISEFNRPFRGLKNLKVLDISKNSFVTLRPGDFYGLSNSVSIVMKLNLLKTISTHAFENVAHDWPKRQVEDFHLPLYEHRQDEAWQPSVNSEVSAVTVCTDNDRMKFVGRRMTNDILPASCRAVNVNGDANLHLDNLGAKSFARHWYRLATTADSVHIETLTLKGNEIENVTRELLNDLPDAVVNVDLSRNKIRRLQRGVVENRRINSLYLSKNSISEIDDGALSEIPNLLRLSLSGNRLRDTKFVATLPQNLKYLYLHGNSITEVSRVTDERFYHSQLTDLNLSNNGISVLRKNSFQAFVSLSNLDLSGNRIRTLESGCFDDVKQLEQLRLRDNDIAVLRARVLKPLSKLLLLDLGRNRLLKISPGLGIKLCPNLEVLRLEYNEIDCLESDILVNPPKRLFNLTSNQITWMPVLNFDSRQQPPSYGANSGNESSPSKEKKIGDVDISMNPITDLYNGELSDFRGGSDNYVLVSENSIQSMQGGTFNVVQ